MGLIHRCCRNRPGLKDSAHYDLSRGGGIFPLLAGTSPADSGRSASRWWSKSSWGGSLSHSESMGGGWEDRGSPGWLVDGKVVGGELADDGGSNQWLPE
jgi:hypothetical protein